jgi:hypothetical protein
MADPAAGSSVTLRQEMHGKPLLIVVVGVT